MLAEEGVGECREAVGRDEALAAVTREMPDLALVDLSPGTDDALQLVAELSSHNIPLLVCSTHDESSYVRRALAAGAHCYITKREAPRELARTVRDVLEGCSSSVPAPPRAWAEMRRSNEKNYGGTCLGPER